MIEDGRASMDVVKGEKAFIKATEIAMNEYALIQFIMKLQPGQPERYIL